LLERNRKREAVRKVSSIKRILHLAPTKPTPETRLKCAIAGEIRSCFDQGLDRAFIALDAPRLIAGLRTHENGQEPEVRAITTKGRRTSRCVRVK